MREATQLALESESTVKGSAAGASALGMEKSKRTLESDGREPGSAVSTSASGAVGGASRRVASMGASLGRRGCGDAAGIEPAYEVGDGHIM